MYDRIERLWVVSYRTGQDEKQARSSFYTALALFSSGSVFLKSPRCIVGSRAGQWPSPGSIDLPFSCVQCREPQALLLIIYTVSLGAVLTHCR